MLKELHVKNYVLIDSLDIDFPEGLVIVTGQTGAGKSIMTGALAMVSGGKTDVSVIGNGADSCVVEALFYKPDDEALRLAVEENGAEWDDGHLIIRRVVNRTGRSRAFINDCPVSAQVLSAISAHLLDIHSQHQTLLLSDKRFQLSLLDSFSGNGSLLEDCRKAWNRYNDLESELEEISASILKSKAEQEYNEARFRQLDEARLRSGELEELESEQKKLSNAEEIKASLCSIESVFSGEFDDDSHSISSSLKSVQRSLEKLSSFITEAGSLSSRVESCRLELDDICSELSDINSSVSVSPERLEAVDSRISVLYGLLQKFSCRNVEELIELKDSLSASISDISALQEKKENLQQELASVKAGLDSLAAALHEARCASASALAMSIQEKLHFLELPYSVFHVDVIPAGLSSSGADSVAFRFSASGKDPVDIAKCASGGEMSRIMLSVKAIMSRFQKMPTMIFDEIDTGVSGSVADKMGTMICEMGEYMQVFAITHLPQVAAKGKVHYLVSKTIDPATSKAETTIKKLSDGQRVMEVARMLSGASLTDAAIANAKDLLKG